MKNCNRFVAYFCLIVSGILTGCGGSSSSGGTTPPPPPPPSLTVSSISPTTAVAGSGTLTLTVYGTGFVSTTTVKVGGVSDATTYVSGTQVTATVTPQQLASGAQLSVIALNGSVSSGLGAAVNLQVNNPAPTISTLNPSTLAAGTTSPTIAVMGTGYLTATVIDVNGTARTTTYVSATQVNVALTASDVAATGSLSLTAVNAAPGGGTSAAAALTIGNPAPGTSISLAPSLVLTGGATATIVTVTGTNFIPTSTVQLNGVSLATTYLSATQLTFKLTVAQEATAQLDSVSVSNPAPGGGSSEGAQLEILAQTPAPVIASVSPTQFVIGAGPTTMTVTGSNLLARNVSGMPIAGSPLLTSNLLWNNTSLAVQSFSAGSGGVDSIVVQVPVSLVATVGTASITASSQTSTPAVSNAVTVSIVDPPVPTLTSVTANSGVVNKLVEVTLNGTGFQQNSTVSLNGTDGDAQYVNPTTINLWISASSIPTPGAYPITVTTPYGGTSAPLNFTAYVLSVATEVNIANNSMVYNPVNGLFYISVPSAAGLPYGNSVVSIDPVTGALGTPIPVGSEPDKLSLTEDGRYLWVSWYGGTNISKVDLAAGTVAYQFSSAIGDFSIATTSSVAAIPGEPESVVVSNYLNFYNGQWDYPTACNTSLYDRGVLRGSSIGDCSLWAMIVDPSLNQVLGYLQQASNIFYGESIYTGSGYLSLAYNANGLTGYTPGAKDSTYTQTHACEGAIAGGIAYEDSGLFFNSNSLSSGGSFGGAGSIAIDPGVEEVFFLESPSPSPAQLGVFNLSKQTSIATAPIANSLNPPPANSLGSGNCLSRWGTDGLAFRTDTGFVSLRTSLVKDLTKVNADIGVTISPSGANTTGNTTAYTITVTNHGPAPATSVTFTAALPATGVLTSVTPSAGTCSTNGAVTCELGSLANGASANVVIDLLQADAGSVTMTAQVSASETDPVLTNNQATSTLTIASSSYNPVPVLTSISPSLIAGGSSDMVITLSGSNFTSDSTVLLDGTALTTTYLSSNQLEVTVTPAELANAALAALFVANPAPDGGLSSGLPLTVYTVLPLVGANHILYDPYSRKIMASIGVHTSTNPNSIVAITPDTATIGTAVPIGGTPTVLALTSDGQILYAMMPSNITGNIARFNMLTQQPDFTVSGFTATNIVYQVGLQYIATMPGTENTIALDDGINGTNTIWDFNPATKTAVARKYTTNPNRGSCMAFPNATSMFTPGLDLFTIDSDGIANVVLNDAPYTYSMIFDMSCFKLRGNNLFTQTGLVVNIENTPATLSGVFNELVQDSYIPGAYGDPYIDFEADASLGLSYYLNNSNPIYHDETFDSIAIYDNQAYMPMNRLMIPFMAIEGSTGYAGIDVVRWGQDGLALLTDSGNLYLIRGGGIIPQLLYAKTAASLTASSVTSISHGAGNTLFTLTGANFAPGVAVTWNGSYRTTTIVDATHVTVAIPASDLASAGGGSLVATNPGATASGALTVTIN